MPAGDKCPVCGAGLLPLFTGTYCPRGDDDHAAWREEVRAALADHSVWKIGGVGGLTLAPPGQVTWYPIRLAPDWDDDPTQP